MLDFLLIIGGLVTIVYVGSGFVKYCAEDLSEKEILGGIYYTLILLLLFLVIAPALKGTL